MAGRLVSSGDADGLPPGPRLPRFLQAYLFLRQPGWFIPAMHRRYGDVFSLRVPPYADSLVVFSSPEAIKEIFQADPHLLHAGEGNQILGFVMGENSVLMTDEQAHARVRGLLMPAFNGSALRGYRSMICELAAAEACSWSHGATIHLHERMNSLTLDIIIRVVFGVTDETIKSELVHRLGAIISINPLVVLGSTYPRLKPFGLWRRFADNQTKIDDLLYREIEQRRRAADLSDRTDVLSRLLQHPSDTGDALTDAELRDQLITLLLAGHETTATALTWTLWELARSPMLQGRARAAVHGGDTKFLEATFKEGMRLHTIIAATARKLAAPTTIGGHHLPAGTVVNTSILLAHQDPDNHVLPDIFRPDRFLGAGPAPNTWLPFGGGIRRCLGAAFATVEGTAILEAVLSAWTLTPKTASERTRVRNITLAPKNGAPVTISQVRQQISVPPA